MDFRIVCPHGPTPLGVVEFAEKRFRRLARHFDDPSCRLLVELLNPVGETKNRYYECCARLNVPRRASLVVHERAKDPYGAVAAAEHSLMRVLDEWHERIRIGSRWPKKYYVAKLVEKEAWPLILPTTGAK